MSMLTLPSRAAALALAATIGAATLPTEAEARPCPPKIVVHYGDTLAGIAGYCRTTVRALMFVNPQITHPSRIYAGEVIRVPSPRATRRWYRRHGYGPVKRHRGGPVYAY